MDGIGQHQEPLNADWSTLGNLNREDCMPSKEINILLFFKSWPISIEQIPILTYHIHGNLQFII